MTGNIRAVKAALFALLVIVLVSFVPAQSCASSFEIYGDRISKFERGTRVTRGAVAILDLHGTWREMGRQYGRLMSGELRQIYSEAILGEIASKRPENMEAMRRTAEDYRMGAPFSFREVIAGMAETSGLSAEELLLVNCVEKNAGLALCSGVAAWGEYASGALVYGRNYDYFPSWFKKLGRDIAVATWHPADGSLAAATVGYAGEIYAMNGLNENGLFIELNNGSPSGGGVHFNNRTHVTQSLFAMLFEAPDMRYVDSFFHTVNSNGAYIIGVADKNGARAYEWPIFGVRQSSGAAKDGLMVITNHFTDESWGLNAPAEAKSLNSSARRRNLTALAVASKGRIDAALMMKILDTPFDKGGATMAEFTMYQLVVEPGSLALWIKIPGVQEWTKIDMRVPLSKTGI